MAYNKNLNISPNNVVNISGSLITLTGSLSGAQVSGTTAQFTTITASVISASSYIGIPTSPISIGDTITGGTANSILFVNPAATIAEDNPSFTYEDASRHISLTSDAGMSFKASDVGEIINSYNTSAGSANQFFINHNLANVELGNLRGNTIVTSGNVGINVNATQATFAKFITRSSAGLIALTENAGLSSVIAWDDTGSSNTLRLAGNPLVMTGDGGGGAEHVRVTSTGNVGIGTTVPNFTLAVTGTLGVSGSTTLSTISGTTAQFTALTASAITSSGTITCLSLVETSTRRIKKDIYSMQSQIENIKKLNPVNYVRILDNKQEFGFIAEELKEVYPEFVIGDGVNYPKMVSVLVSAVQELTQKIEKQQDEIELLKNKKNSTRGKK